MEQLHVVDSHWLNLRVKEEFRELEFEEKSFLEEESRREYLYGEFLRLSSSLPINKSKNRYSQFRPLESSRVILSGEDNYINANFISGEVPNSDKSYIACQAPIESTIDDFWRMIWENRSGIVVMLTDFEIRNSKATPYWPEIGCVKRFGDLLVYHKKNFLIGEIEVRSLLVKKADSADCGSGTREIIHLQYRNWPDFGIPSSTKPIRDLLLLVNRFRERTKDLYSLEGPIVVHCSAGVGRSGVFIACHITLEKIRYQQTPNIKQTVKKMRTQRQGVVRTEDQYSLIYTVLVDSLKTNLIREWTNTVPKISSEVELAVEVK